MRGLLAIAFLVATCGPAYEPWPKTAGDTTCREWVEKMTVDQRHGLGGALLKGLWDRDGAAAEPPDELITKFANAVGGTCTAYPDEKVSTVAVGLYELSDDVKP